jgi:uncharacterized protein (UPF0335 family)
VSFWSCDSTALKLVSLSPSATFDRGFNTSSQCFSESHVHTMARLATSYLVADYGEQLETRLGRVTQIAQKLHDLSTKCQELFRKISSPSADVENERTIIQKLQDELMENDLALFRDALSTIEEVLRELDRSRASTLAKDTILSRSHGDDGGESEEQDAATTLVAISGELRRISQSHKWAISANQI